MRKSLTLIELSISLSLAAAIILTAFSFNIMAKKAINQSKLKIELANELSYILTHIHKSVMQSEDCFGWTDLPLDYTSIQSFFGDDLYIKVDNKVTSATADDTWVSYSFNAADELQYCPDTILGWTCNTTYQILSTHIVSVKPNGLPRDPIFSVYPASIATNLTKPYRIKLSPITLRHDPLSAVDALANPEIMSSPVLFDSYSQAH